VDLDEAVAVLARWRARDTVVVAEERVAFDAELAALVARRPGGETVAWRTVETAQIDGMCREVRVPGDLDEATAREGAELAQRVASHVGAVGVLAVELFAVDGRLLVNEIALRPHNSGHWTIEGAVTSQFENHLRAVLDLPLGATDLAAPTVATVNILGASDGAAPSVDDALDDPYVKVHLYGKAPRPGRKLGHVTVTGSEADDVAARARRAAAALGTPIAQVAR
jgi:5-(carboxyamino)imidazole ribonucleotide synthase